ncbi:uncharacterized protein [Halyomorpha halys]|uniref:uncharacterized protein n=1 Tax=Halyomorpha halys TaxID=286706 RepID=UPI0006D521BF|nr:uncharacterized protein LOC106691785 [Halyomorpha halys]
MEDIWSTLSEYYEDDFETNLFNEECLLYTRLIGVLKKKVSTESLFGEEEQSSSSMLLKIDNEIGYHGFRRLDENDPNYTIALQKAFLWNNPKEKSEAYFRNLAAIYGDDDSKSGEMSLEEEDSSSSTNVSEEILRLYALSHPAYLAMVGEIMFGHSNVNRIGKVRFGWSRGSVEFVMLETLTEWKSIYPIMHDQSLFFTIHLPMVIKYFHSKYPNRAKVMKPRFIVTKRAETLNKFLSCLLIRKNVERFQVLAAINKALERKHTKPFIQLNGLLENLTSCVKRLDYTAIQRMAVASLSKLCILPEIIYRIITERNLDIIYTFLTIIRGRLPICDGTSRENVSKLFANITKIYHLEFSAFLIENVNLRGLFSTLGRTLKHKIVLSIMRFLNL